MEEATVSEMYSGDSSYKLVNSLIKNNDKNLLVISPYIGNYYVKMLDGASSRKKIDIITSSVAVNSKNSKLKLIGGLRAIKYLKLIIYFTILDVISSYLNFYYTTAILSIILMLLALLFYRSCKLGGNIRLKVAKDKFVHEKLYISDSIAIVGSANLTYKGMHKNIEHIEVVKDREKIKQLKKHFDDLWKKY